MIGGAAVALAIKISADAKGANADIDSAEKHVSKLGTAGKAAGKLLAAGLVVAAAAAVKFTQAAADDAQGQAKLAATAKQVAGATDAQTASMESWITAQGKSKGVADDELRPALERLLVATHSVSKSQELASLAMDISAKRGQSLESVTQSLAKAQTGSVAGLSKYGVQTKDAAGHVKSLAEVQAELAKAYTGSAAAAAGTAAGKAKIAQVQYGELQEQIGTGLLPVMEKLLTVGLAVTAFVSNHTKAVGLAAAAVGGLLAVTAVLSTVTGIYAAVTGVATAETLAQKAAVLVASVATKTYAAAQWILNAAMTANPIGLVVLAIVALVAALVLAYKHSETFRNIVNGAFKAVATAAGAAVSFIKDHWKLLLAILTGPIGAAVILIAGHWSDIRTGAGAVIQWVKDKWGDLKSLLSTPFEQAKNAISTAFGAVTSIIQGVAGTVQSVIDKVNSLIAALQKLAGASGSAHGAGQFGGNSDPGTSTSNRSAVLGGGGSTVSMTVNFNGVVGDPRAVAGELDKLLRRHRVSNGRQL